MSDITGRDDYMIACALFYAAKALKAKPHPPESDIEDMEKILEERFPQFKKLLEIQDKLSEPKSD